RAAINAAQGTATVRNVSVARAKDGVQVEIAANATLTHKEMRLTNPDRVVIDLINAVPAVRTSNIMVNTVEAHAVRIGRYQAKPPVTRIVVDVAADVNYEVFVDGHRLLVNLRGASTGMKGNPAPPAVPAVNAANKPQQPAAAKSYNTAGIAAKAKAESAATTIAQAKSGAAAQPFVFVEPHYQPKGDAEVGQQQQFPDAQAITPISKQNPADQPPQQPADTLSQPAMQQPAPVPQPTQPAPAQPAPSDSSSTAAPMQQPVSPPPTS